MLLNDGLYKMSQDKPVWINMEEEITQMLIDVMTKNMKACANQGKNEYSFYYTDFQALFRDCVKMFNKSKIKDVSNHTTYDYYFDKVTDYFISQGLEFVPAYDSYLFDETGNELRARKPVFKWIVPDGEPSPFYNWLMSTYHVYGEKDTPQWDIANEIFIDPCFPKNAEDLDDIEDHLATHNAPVEAFDVLEDVYAEYQKQNKK